MKTTTHLISRPHALIAALFLGLAAALLLILASSPSVRAAGVIYVDTDAPGPAHDGLSWTTAYTNVQDALSAAVYGDEIWVAEGVYYPDQGAGQTEDDRTSTFTLKPGVALYGGFPTGGGDGTIDARDWTACVTVLSGDIDGNDATDPYGVVTTTTAISGNNAYHVLWLDGVTDQSITGTTTIDGFTITAGKADGSDPHSSGGGLYCAGNGSGNECSPTLTHVTFSGNLAFYRGGGMFNNGMEGASSPTLTYVTFSGNSVTSYGGGMFNGGSSGRSSPTLTHVTFSGNSAASNGGGMCNDGSSSGQSSPTLIDVIFNSNLSGYGGGMFNDGFHGVSNSTLTNVIFSDNSATYYGGGMCNWGCLGESNPTLTNVTLSGNSADVRCGGIFNDGRDDGQSNPILINVVLWGNSAPSGPEIYNADNSTPAIAYSDIQGCGGSNGWDSTCGTDGGGNIDADPHFVDAVNGDLHLQLDSSCIDAGNNYSVTVATDLEGNPRFWDISGVIDTGNGTPPIVDMGAYEVRILKVYLPLAMKNMP